MKQQKWIEIEIAWWFTYCMIVTTIGIINATTIGISTIEEIKTSRIQAELAKEQAHYYSKAMGE